MTFISHMHAHILIELTHASAYEVVGNKKHQHCLKINGKQSSKIPKLQESSAISDIHIKKPYMHVYASIIL